MATRIRRRNPIPVLDTFHERVTITLDGDVQDCHRQTLYRSPTVRTRGYTHIEALVSLTVRRDTNPVSDIALFGAVVEEGGAAGSEGQLIGVGQGFPGLTQKQFGGVGHYTLRSILAGQPTSNRQSITNLAHVGLWAKGAPAGRQLDIDIDGMLLAGGRL